LKLIAGGVTDVFSAAVRDQLGKGLGEGAPSVGLVQKAVGRLTRGEILVRVERGEYHVQDDVFLDWLKRSD
jgi:tetrahydromethanopterin S-methyltransferase subunit C